MKRRPVLIAAAAMMAAATPATAARLTPEARLAKILAGRVAGEPVSCIRLADITESRIVDRTAIVYRVGANRLYVNRPRGGAARLDEDDILVTHPTNGELCSIDSVRLIDRTSGFPTGFVNLGAFVPYVKG